MTQWQEGGSKSSYPEEQVLEGRTSQAVGLQPAEPELEYEMSTGAWLLSSPSAASPPLRLPSLSTSDGPSDSSGGRSYSMPATPSWAVACEEQVGARRQMQGTRHERSTAAAGGLPRGALSRVTAGACRVRRRSAATVAAAVDSSRQAQALAAEVEDQLRKPFPQAQPAAGRSQAASDAGAPSEGSLARPRAPVSAPR